jgi:hypothetical protein
MSMSGEGYEASNIATLWVCGENTHYENDVQSQAGTKVESGT